MNIKTAWGRFMTGLSAFRESMLASDSMHVDDFLDFDSRRVRYAMNWAAYENNVYRNIHSWAVAYRQQYGLYRYIRSIYSPGYRLGEFYKAHIFGGDLNSAAEESGAIPIATDNEALRPAIAELWKRSRWEINKDILTLRGAVFGDIMIQIIDDVSRGRVYLEILHPGLFKSIKKDPFGNIKAYEIEEYRQDPRSNTARTVKYNEVVSRDGEMVVYETFLDDAPYAWPDHVDRTGEAKSIWQEPYGFVPVVHILHNDIGLDWGWDEAHPIRPKMQEVDDLAAQISDQIRKTVEPVWLMKGMKNTSLTIQGADASTDRPEPGREELNAIWGVPIDGGAEAMVADLDFESALVHLDGILKEIEREYPELSNITQVAGDASGRALRVARQPVVAKVIQRRAGYDAGLISAQQMAISIGGFRNYEGYAGFGLDSYDQGALEHSIADRPVFENDPLDATEVSLAEWQSARAAIEAGVSLEGYLKDQGWSEERIAQLGIVETEAEQLN